MIEATVGQTVSVELPYSEVCMFLRLAGTRVNVLVLDQGAQLLNADGTNLSFPITHGEAGIRVTETVRGYIACSCCGIDMIGLPGDRCDSCREVCADEPTATADNWHCFTAHCDGSGCTYPGECEDADVRA